MNDNENDINQLPLTPEEETEPKSKRKFLLIMFTAGLILIALLYGIYWLVVARFYAETDNAYVNGNIIPITSQVSGTVNTVKVDDTQFVKEGQVVATLNPIDSIVALQLAEARLAETLRDTHQLFINNSGLEANVTQNQVMLDKARIDLGRRNQAIGIGAVSKEELTHANDTYKSADASLVQAKSSLLSNLALTENTDLRHHPNVLAAAASLRQAFIDYKRTIIKAPVAGEISKKAVQVGQRINVGTMLMAVVPLEQIWVDANFKEKELRDMRIGQPVELTADIYGSSVVYHGTVVGFAAGTGSAFALLPAQNATGNWIKVVQRLPVRITLDSKELRKNPLRIGLSMGVSVDIHDTSGKLISETTNMPVYKTTVYDDLGQQADAEIARIMNEDIKKTENLNEKYSSASSVSAGSKK